MAKLGHFNKRQESIFNITQAYLGAYFMIETKESPALNERQIPAAHRRTNGQIDATFVLDSMLTKNLPADAYAIIVLTPLDLYPGNDWNFIFGLGSLQNRVGVWSMARMLSTDSDSVNDDRGLRRVLHVASHETGHIFGLRHCVVYECNMNGSNSLYELDRQVGWLCRDCAAKLCWNRNKSIRQSIESMAKFYDSLLTNSTEAAYYRSALPLFEN